MKQGNPADPFERGDSFEGKIFSNYWLQILLITIVLVVVIFGMFWIL